ncbi:MAG: penicillin-binding protein [Candidatus Nomurabacteria bacterium]|jgi:penicillin-binding protein 1A|nr:penicillin-binding protein [Candidatus Nomurabacteria bacterium]
MKAKKRVAEFQDENYSKSKKSNNRGENAHKTTKGQKPLPRLPRLANLREDGFGEWAKSVLMFVGVWFANLGRRWFRFWFSKRGIILSLKIWGTVIIALVLLVGGMFLYFSKDLWKISPSELDKKVVSTTSRYLDRNGELLWEDRGDGDYRIVVEGSEISQYVRWATVAIEDRNFYKHFGVSVKDTTRALWKTMTGQSVQGGSTLTQQLVKQVFFSDEASDRGLTGIPRKIKEAILAIEVERMYSKDEIMTLYLNQSPFGGRRNGVESGARAYFGKSAKDLTIAEAALLASIPNNPTQYMPFCYSNESEESCNGRREKLLSRQRYAIQVMKDLGYISAEQAEEAMNYDIMATLRPNETQYTDMKAPHFVLEVRKQLEEEFGVAAVRAGGWTVTTTLDLRAQNVMDAEVEKEAELMMTSAASADNMAITSVDVETAQVIAQVGSVDFSIEGYGEVNAATAKLEPASTIKPLVYAALFQQRAGRNYGPGSLLRDEDIDKWYCNDECHIGNTTKRTGDMNIRYALAGSLNRTAVKAMNIVGPEETREVIWALGDKSYCAGQDWVGLSSAFGNGCNVRMDEHANALASLARGGAYKPLVYVLKAVDGNGKVVKQWSDVQGEQVVDPQAAYMVLHILNDPVPRAQAFGTPTTGTGSLGWIVPGVWTASKTGTGSGINNARKDNWFVSVSPVVVTTAWCGKHDGREIAACANNIRRAVGVVQSSVHTEIYMADGRYTKDQAVARPSGIHTMSMAGTTDIAASWQNSSNSGWEEMEMDFDTATMARATKCTLPQNRVSYKVLGVTDYMTGTISIYGGPEGFNPEPIANEEELVCDVVVGGEGDNLVLDPTFGGGL